MVPNGVTFLNAEESKEEALALGSPRTKLKGGLYDLPILDSAYFQNSAI